MRNSIKILKAALDEVEDGTIIMRGVVSPDSFHHLQVDVYQREVLPITSLNRLVSAFEIGDRIPDIELGMRGQTFLDREGVFYLQDPVFIIDGLQRTSAALQGMQSGRVVRPHLGCVVHFDTTMEWERERFRILNSERMRVSPNVLLRNMRDDHPAIAMLYKLCRDPSFVMGERVSWSQKMKRGELITARTYVGVAARLHSHAGPGKSTGLIETAQGLDKIMRHVGRTTMRDNVKAFFDILDSAWGIRRVVYRAGAAYVKMSFLSTLAQVLSDHTNFWRHDGSHLFVNASLVRKIGQFPITDPNVVSLVSSGSNKNDFLYQLLARHINSGKRTQRLVPRSLAHMPTVCRDGMDDANGAEPTDESVAA